MATIREVALKAGVGIGTVSRALNGTGYIAEETKKKIMDAVEELEYRPNELAQNFFRNRSGFVGVLVPNLEHPFFSYLTKYMERELYKHGYKCMVCDVDDEISRQEEFFEMLRRNTMDGLITCVPIQSEGDRSGILRPIVAIDQNLGKNIPIIRSDHWQGGKMAAKLLQKAGCRLVLLLSPKRPHRYSAGLRYQAFEQTMEQNGCEVITLPVSADKMDFGYSLEEVRKHTEYLSGADAVFATDLIAAACLKLAHEKGIDVPGKLKIIGYDGLPLGGLLYPTLTTVCQNIPELARCGVETVVKMINGRRDIQQEYVIGVSMERGGTV